MGAHMQGSVGHKSWDTAPCPCICCCLPALTLSGAGSSSLGLPVVPEGRSVLLTMRAVARIHSTSASTPAHVQGTQTE